MMAPVNTPPGLFLKDDSCTLQAPPGLSLADQEVSRPVVAPPPGLERLEIHTTTTKSIGLPPGLSQIPEEKQVATEEVKRQVFSLFDHLDVKDDEVPACKHLSSSAEDYEYLIGYNKLQKQIFEKKQVEKKFQRLQALVTCVGEIEEIQRSVSSLNARVKKDATSKTSSGSDSEASVTTMASSAAPAKKSLWSKKESKSHAGKFYYVHSKSGKTSWTVPEDYAEECPISPVSAVSVPAVSKLADGFGTKAVAAGIDLSDYYDDSTDDESDSDYDSDFARSVLSHASSRDTQVGGSSTFRVDAPVFMPSFQKGFRATAPAFQPGALSGTN